MRKSWKKTVYIAKKKKNKESVDIINRYGKVQYLKPKKYLFNIQPLVGSTDLMSYGQKSMQMQKAIIDFNQYFGFFEEDDLAYLDGINPENEKIIGEKANYRIDAVLNQNKVIAIYFERLPTK